MTFYDTLEEQVEGETNEDVSYRTLHNNLLININESLRLNIPYESIIDKYRYYLKGIIMDYEMQEEDYPIFRYNPQVMSEALYGTPLLWFVLMDLNNCTSRFEFDMKVVKCYDKEELIRFISDIMIKEEELKYNE